MRLDTPSVSFSVRMRRIQDVETDIIALFTDNCTHLHNNTIQRRHEAISGNFVIYARNCLAFVFNFIVMQM